MSILYSVHRVAAAASPQLLQAIFGGIPLPPLTWSHSSWQAGKSSYRSAVPYRLGGKRVTGTKKERIVSALFAYLLYPGPGQ